MSNSTLGERLKTAREALPASIFQAARETKIRADFLEYMERDNFRFMSGSTYIRGLLKSYARYVGLPEDELLQEFERNHAQAGPPSVKQIFREPAAAPKNRRPHWVIAAAIAAGTLVTLSFVGLMKPAGPNVATPPAPDEVASATPTTEPTSPAPQIAAAPIHYEGVQLTVSIVGEKCWIRVEADGDSQRPVYEGTLYSGAVETYRATDNLKVVFGNLGAVKLMVNGRELQIPREKGQGQIGTFVFHSDTTSLGSG